MRKLKGFTLIELLVVIAIIALLMSVLMPAMSKVKKQAQSTVCKSGEKQLALAFSMFANDNKGYFMGDYDMVGWVKTGHENNYFGDDGQAYMKKDFWIWCTEKYYRDPAALLCASAPIPKDAMKDKTGFDPAYGKPFEAWGPFWWGPNIKTAPKDAWQYPNKQQPYGSYGINAWICNTYVMPVDEQPSPNYNKKFYRTAGIKDAHDAPMLMDATWFHFGPDLDDKPSMYPPEYEGQPAWAGGSTSIMTRMCFDRHLGGINVAFLDYTIRGVGVKQLWGLKWNKAYEVPNIWTKGHADETQDVQASAWPQWMSGFKE